MKLSKSEVIAIAGKIRDEHNDAVEKKNDAIKKRFMNLPSTRIRINEVVIALKSIPASIVSEYCRELKYIRDSIWKEEQDNISLEQQISKPYRNDFGEIENMIVLNAIGKDTVDEIVKAVKQCLSKKS